MSTFMFNAKAKAFKSATDLVSWAAEIRTLESRVAALLDDKATLEAASADKDAVRANLERIYTERDNEAQALKAENEALKADFQALKAANEVLDKQLKDSIATHDTARANVLDPDQIAAQAVFAVANVEPVKPNKYEVFRAKKQAHGLFVPYFYKVDLAFPVGPNNGVQVMDRGHLKELLAAGEDVYYSEKRPPAGVENTEANRVQTYVPFSEILVEQAQFEVANPNYTVFRQDYKKGSRDPYYRMPKGARR